MTYVMIATNKHIPAPIPNDTIIYGYACSAAVNGNCSPFV